MVVWHVSPAMRSRVELLLNLLSRYILISLFSFSKEPRRLTWNLEAAWAEEMAQQVKALAAKPSDPSLIPETPWGGGEN